MEIKFNNVTIGYDHQNPILSDLNFALPDQKIIGIVGKNGSGKSSFLQTLAARLPIIQGEISIDNHLLPKQPKDPFFKKKIALLCQEPEITFLGRTVEQELKIVLKNIHYRTEKIAKRIHDTLVMIGLPLSYLSKDPFSLSEGEKRLLGIAKVIIINPKIILLDEPFIGLDCSYQRRIIKIIKMLKKRYHRNIVIASNDVSIIHHVVDHIVVLDQGKIIMNDDKYSCFKQEKRLKKLGIPCPNEISFSNKVLEKKGIKIGYRDEINDLIKDIYRNWK